MQKFKEGRNSISLEEHGNVHYLNKVIKGPKIDALRRFHNCLKWEELRTKQIRLNSPELIGYDEDDLSLKYQWIENATSLEEELEGPSPNFKNRIVEAVNMLVTLHTSNLGNVSIDSESELPQHESLLDSLDKYEYASCTGAELELFRLLQQDSELIEAIMQSSEDNEVCTCHGDIRLDQFIYTDDKLWIIDFEEFRKGDPTRDLAGIIGAIYFDCLLKTFTETTQETSNAKKVEAQMLERGKNYIAQMTPTMQLAYQTYASKKTMNKIQFAKNIGWFLLERIMSRAKYSFRLSAIDKAILGIGREIIVFPEKLTELFE
ncbi:phosphotransferase [Staphylococcus saccharolyticus]|uniref:Trehalose synthase-fused probable maltokinase n=1 Tax=Staphylococcus saccharolyticus TaxID=33028 RepID=A0A380GY37_9STAP|nr:phosphotransferase [Staphylococcus saccharolyticus]MBL7564508.1 phosphotransferase [Staphylococcus saccharolyticus]MBL7571228.1 phosphotransferase [Staphylococcus saccharolyticus]QQB99065.1 phosphotransferase [Staphylococcus saccharolyticus]QRJ66721.1 phosphotransferase [Staphylococcus saccharolyticus]RTX99677.1 aminoglycoside phosphotransferase family protein [Staphylococcus saccharolyticus]